MHSDNDEESLYACCCTQKVTAKGCHRYSILAVTSDVSRKFPRGVKFRHNRVASQINFRESGEATTILVGPRACSRETFAKLHLKYAFLYILEASFSIMLLRD